MGMWKMKKLMIWIAFAGVVFTIFFIAAYRQERSECLRWQNDLTPKARWQYAQCEAYSIKLPIEKIKGF